jgi:hypothetical protein
VHVRGFGLLTCGPFYSRVLGTPVPPDKRVLEKTVDLWSAVSGSNAKPVVDRAAVEDLFAIITRAVTDLACIGSPADLTKILARQARDANDALPEDLKPVKPLLDDYRQALGFAFDINDEKGAHFFRSSLVQSIFYAVFAAWILWDKERPPALPSRSSTPISICLSLFWTRCCTTSDIRRPGIVHCLDDTVEFALAGRQEQRHAVHAGAAKCGLDAADMARPGRARPISAP